MAKLKPDVIEWILKLNSKQAQEEYHKLEKENRELQKQNTATRKSMVELEKQGKKGSEEWKNLKNAISANNRTMAENKAKMQEIAKQFDLAGMTVAQLRNHLKNLKREFENTSRATNPERYQELQQQIEKTNQALIDAKNGTSRLRLEFTKLRGLKDAVQGFFLGIGNAIFNNFIGAFKNAFNIIVDFEKENAKLAAILGTTEDGIKDLTKAARELGSSTSYSAAEVTQLQIELAKLGYSKEQIIDMEGAVLKFARAVNTDLASASAFTGGALRIFGKDASEAESALATFAIATNKTALDFSKLETALSTVGPVAAAAGFSLEDTTTILGVLANANIDASTAATATRNIILKMVNPAGDLAKALGGPCKTADELAAGLQRLQAAGVDLETSLELTDTRAVAAFRTIMEQSGSLVALRDSITGVDEQFNQMAETMSNTLSGAMAGLRSASEELLLRIFLDGKGELKDLINHFTGFVRKLQEAVDWIKQHSRWIKTLVATLVTWKATQLAVNVAVAAGRAILKAKTAVVALYQAGVKGATAVQNFFTQGVKLSNISLKALKTTMLSMPWGAILQAVASIVAMFVTWSSAADDVAESEENLSEAQRAAAEREKERARKLEELNSHLEVEKNRLLDLHRIASDVTVAEEERKKAIDELNKVCPTYNGYIDAETKALKANKEALDQYIQSAEKKARLAYYREQYQEYLKAEEEARFKRIQDERRGKEAVEAAQQRKKEYLEKNHISETPLYPMGTSDGSPNYTAEDYMFGIPLLSMGGEWYELGETAAVQDTENFLKDSETALGNYKEDWESKNLSFKDYLLLSGDESSSTVTDSGKVVLPSKDKNKAKEDKIKKATAAAEALHQKNLAVLEQQKEDLAETDYVIQKSQEMIRYCEDLTEALKKLKDQTSDTDKDLLNKIDEKQGKVDQETAKARQAMRAAEFARELKSHKDQIEASKARYEALEQQMKKSVQNEEKVQEAADILLLSERRASYSEQIREMEEFRKKVESSDLIGAEKKKEVLKKLDEEIRKAQNQLLTDTGLFAEKLRSMSENPNGLPALSRAYERQVKEITQTYEAMLQQVEEGSEDAVNLAAERDRRLLVLQNQYQQQLYGLQEKTGLSWANEYDLELLRLKEMHAEGIITEEQYQKKRLELGVNNAKKYFDFYSGLATSMFQAIQEAEIAASDAKYDALIRQAENNGEDTAKLEEEKENKKLEIQKKYADVNFAIKVGQIIADTAVSIMKAFADLGPIGGAVAAAMLTATGAAQVVMANAERQKIKNLQPKSGASTDSAGSVATATRTLSGFSEGGYTGNGGRFEVAGVVHKGEYVVPMPIMNNPRVVDAVGTIEAIRLSRKGSTQGFAKGGYTSGRQSGSRAGSDYIATALPAEMKSMINEMRDIFRNVKAYVVLQDLEKKQKQLDKARAPFTRR